MRYKETPYHKRVAARLARAKEHRGNAQANHYTEVDRFMLAYELAYFDYYHLHITLQYNRGWYYINNHRYRHRQIEEMTNNLLARVQAEYAPNPEEQNDV